MPAEKTPAAGNLDDDDYPAYTMGRAADLLGTTPAFLRAVGEAELITPLRSEGGHRRYSRRQLRIAARARELVDQGTPIEAACRISHWRTSSTTLSGRTRTCAGGSTRTARISSPAVTDTPGPAG